MNKVSHNVDAPIEAIDEARRRNGFDGIPRHVYSDGRIMKYDWVLETEPDLDIEEHVRNMLNEQTQ